MTNLNTLITDEDDDVVDELSNVESDKVMPSITDLDKLLGATENFSVDIEALYNKIDLYKHICSHKVISKNTSKIINDVYGNFYNNRMTQETFTEYETKTNYDNSIIFMEANIANDTNNLVEILRHIFDTGLTECEDFYEKFANVIQPVTIEAYNEIYSLITDQESLVNLESLLFLDSSKNKFVNVFDMPFHQLVNEEIYDTDNNLYKKDLASYIKNDILPEYIKLLDNNVKFAKLTKLIADSDKPIPMTDIVKIELNYSDISIADIFSIFRGSKGYWYYSNIQYILDYVVNVVSLKKVDYDSLKDDGTLTNYLFDIKEEIKDIRDVLEFMLQYVNSIGKFFDISRALFTSLIIT